MTWEIVEGECKEWLRDQPENSFHSIITDPPYGLVEYTSKEIEKMKRGVGGIWRIPPRIGGSERMPLPRFTVLTKNDVRTLHSFFVEWGKVALPVLRPGGHLFLASNPLLVHVVTSALVESGFESRGVVVRLVRTLKGGFRPKNAEVEFEDISSMPRSSWEPWAVLRKPFDGLLSANLRQWEAGGLRRDIDGNPFSDVVPSTRTPSEERRIAPHPSLKPQAFLRRLVWASLPLARGRILDPFCGAGSTLAAANALGFESVGVESNKEYSRLARRAVPRLAALDVDMWIKLNGSGAEPLKHRRQSHLLTYLESGTRGGEDGGVDKGRIVKPHAR